MGKNEQKSENEKKCLKLSIKLSKFGLKTCSKGSKIA